MMCGVGVKPGQIITAIKSFKIDQEVIGVIKLIKLYPDMLRIDKTHPRR
jgi:hypothetical protein